MRVLSATSHDLAVVRKVADRKAVFQSGKLVELGMSEQIFSEPLSGYTRSVIAAVLVVDGTKLRLRNRLVQQK
ncbi:MAG: hypothetical protein AB8B64_11250 [Granulosicoccus sp.]